MLKRPFSSIAVKAVRVSGRDGHRALLAEAKRSGLYLWYGDVIERDGKVFAGEPHLVDWDSVPDEPQSPSAKRADQVVKSELRCLRCGKKCSSTSGLTLHLNRCSR